MLQEVCCREITSSLHRSLAKSFLEEFAAKLDVDIRRKEVTQFQQPGAMASQANNAVSTS